MALAILFDIDGTLLDTLDAIVHAMNAACDELGIGPHFEASELRPRIGTPVQHQLDILRDVRGPLAETFADRYYAHFTKLVDRGVEPFPGVRETFPLLRSRAIGTMSTRRRSEAVHMMRVAGLEPYFTTITGGDEVGRPKPNPDLPLHAARSLAVPPERCVVVGDAPVDILAGRAAGMLTVAATYGYGDRLALLEAKPSAGIARFADLPKILENLDARETAPGQIE